MNYIIAPHPDDEILGCCSVLLSGYPTKVIWVTNGNSKQRQRSGEVERVFNSLSFVRLDFFECDLDAKLGVLVVEIGKAIDEPGNVFVPSMADYHSDHRMVAAACHSVFKPLRGRARAVYEYEVPTETPATWTPNAFRRLSAVDKASMMGRHYPEEAEGARGALALLAHTQMRGAQAGIDGAEAFRLIWEVEK